MLSSEIADALKEVRFQAKNLVIEARLSRHSNRTFHAEAVAGKLETALKKLESFLNEP